MPNRSGKDRPQGPRPELITEMRDYADVDFHLYETSIFIGLANKQLNENTTETENEALVAEVETRTRHSSRPRIPSLYGFSDTALANAAAKQANLITTAHDLPFNDAAFRALVTEPARQAAAVLRLPLETYRANQDRLVAQVLRNMAIDKSLLYGTGTSSHKASKRDEQNDWDDESEGDEEADGDPNDDNNSDNPTPTPTPEES